MIFGIDMCSITVPSVNHRGVAISIVKITGWLIATIMTLFLFEFNQLVIVMSLLSARSCSVGTVSLA